MVQNERKQAFRKTYLNILSYFLVSKSFIHYNRNMFNRYQKFVLAMSAFLQFTIILDFMIISPMGALIMPGLDISPAQFGTVVSAYAFAAGMSGILTSGFADRFDRKHLLIFFYIGFILATALCGIADSYEALLIARTLTGFFGGVVGATGQAIITDLFPMALRGRAIATVQTAFAASQVLGIPAGLFISARWGWEAPFLMIAAFGILAGIVIVFTLGPVRDHLSLRVTKNPFKQTFVTLTNRDYTLAFFTTALVSTGGFMLMPFASDFSVHNLGIDLEHLPMVYLVTGISSLFVLPLVGRLADRIGKYPTFVGGGVLNIIMVLIYTNLGVTPLPVVMLINVLVFLGIFSRMVPSQALISAVPAPANRGSFMAVSSSLQQMSGGFAAILAGWIVSRAPNGQLLHYNVAGLVLVGTVVTTMITLYFINKKVSTH